LAVLTLVTTAGIPGVIWSLLLIAGGGWLLWRAQQRA
jgi:hypothetical protein